MVLNFKLTSPSGSTQKIKVYSLPCIFGRSTSCDVILKDPAVSKKHFRIFASGRELFIEDLGSKNGTLLNGKRIKSSKLSSGDVITAGRTEIVLEKDPRQSNLLEASDEQEVISSIFEAVKIMLLPVDEKYLISSVLEYILQIFTFERVLFFQERDGKWEITGEAGVVDVEQYPPGELISEAIKSSEKIIETDTTLLSYEVKSAYLIPVIESIDVLGAIYMESFSGTTALSERDKYLLTSLTESIAVFLKSRMLEKELEKEKTLRNNLSKFVPPDAVDALLKDKNMLLQFTNKLQKERVTALFADIVGFSSLSENLSSSETAILVSEFMSLGSDTIFKYGGSINKYIGDAIFALFGTPIPTGDEERRAVQCAREMISRISQISHPFLTKPLQLRIGINTGECAIGFVGPPERPEYTAIGDTINVAARLQTFARPGQILVGEETFKQAKNFFKFKKIGSLKLKGKTRPVNVYAVL